MSNPSSPPHIEEFAPKFEALVRMHYARLYGVAYSYLRAADAAEDAVQGALLKVWRRGGALDLDAPLPFLFRAVRNQCITELRRQRRWHDVELDDVDTPFADETAFTPIAELEAADLSVAIEQAIGELPERCRLIFLMSREQELTYIEIARTLGISPKTVETQMGKALRRLRQRLARFLPVTF